MRLYPSMQTSCSTRELGAFNHSTKEEIEKFAATGELMVNGKLIDRLHKGQTILFVDMPEAGVGIGVAYKANGTKFLVPAIQRKKDDNLFITPLLNKKAGNLGVHYYIWTFNGPDEAAIEKKAA